MDSNAAWRPLPKAPPGVAQPSRRGNTLQQQANMDRIRATSPTIARSRSGSDVLLQEVLDDETKCEAFMKKLISVADLKSAWDSLDSRLVAAEDHIQEILVTAGRQVLEQDFVLMEEYRLTVDSAHSTSLVDHKQRLETLEAKPTDSTLQTHRRELDVLRERLDELERRFADALKDLARVEQQDGERHDLVLQRLAEAKAETDANWNSTVEQFRTAVDRQADAEQAHSRLEGRVDAQADFLSGPKLMGHIRSVCKDILQDYIPWSEMDAQACKAANGLLDPIRASVAKEEAERIRALEGIHKKHGELAQTVEGAGKAIREQGRDQVAIVKRMDSFVTLGKLDQIDAKFLLKVQSAYEQTDDLNRVMCEKIHEVVDRLSELQEILEDHEHALEHQAEELLNRATKYDLVVNTHRIDHCASKEKVESEIKELVNTTPRTTSPSSNYGSVSPETLLRSLEDGKSDVSGKQGQLGIPHSVASTPSTQHRGSTSELLPSSTGLATDYHSMLRQQLERLAEASVLFAHYAIIDKTGTRESRLEREHDVLHHLSSVLYWIQTRNTPSDWEPMRLTTLALQCMRAPQEGDATKKRRSAYGSSSGISPSTRSSARRPHSLETGARDSSPQASVDDGGSGSDGEFQLGETPKEVSNKPSLPTPTVVKSLARFGQRSSVPVKPKAMESVVMRTSCKSAEARRLVAEKRKTAPALGAGVEIVSATCAGSEKTPRSRETSVAEDRSSQPSQLPVLLDASGDGGGGSSRGL
mmetsp:Transcript_60287/g.168384  ORF Transcript_60287/g.168384 Transcript_60287/m.168384 type:complete len:757 (+) Transcript_60287:103-2373(+)